MSNKKDLMFDETARVAIAGSADKLRSEIQSIFTSATRLKGLVQNPMPIEQVYINEWWGDSERLKQDIEHLTTYVSKLQDTLALMMANNLVPFDPYVLQVGLDDKVGNFSNCIDEKLPFN